jgi:hypothetical protein
LPAASIQRLLADPFTLDHVLGWALAWTGFGSRGSINRLAGLGGTGAGGGFIASNGWMVSSTASASGNPMMVSDPHLPAESPSFYRGSFATLHGPGLGVGGWFFPGMPFPALGFNSDLSWTATSNGVDHHDVWTADTDSATSYTVGTTPTSIVRSTVTLSYVDRATGVPGTRSFSLAWADSSRDLPILKEDLYPPASPHYAHIVFAGATFVTAGTTLVEFLAQLAMGSTLGDAQTAVDGMALPDQNLLVLHQSGDMGYWWLARAPLRAPGGPGLAALQGLLDGNDPTHRWLGGVHPASSLPGETYLAGPGAVPEVWINNNVGPEWVRPASQGTIVPAQYPSGMILSHPYPTWRQARARQLLAPPVTSAANRDAALDQADPWMPALAPYFHKALQELRAAGVASPDPLADAILAILGAWDGDAHRHSPIAAYAYLLRAKYEQLLGLNQGLAVPFVTDPSLPGPYTDLPVLGSFGLASHAGDVLAMGIAAHLTLYDLYPAVANPSQQNPSFAAPWSAASPWLPSWDPSPWSAFGPLLELGHIKALDLTPPGAAPGLGAMFPLGGSKDSLYQTGSWDLAASLDETYVGGQIASAVVANRTAVGTTRLMVIEFTASGPEVSYLAPVGMTEIATDPRRYLPAQDFADRQSRPLHFDVATITSPAHAIRVTPLVMPP